MTSETLKKELQALREQINAVDDALLTLLNERATLALGVGKLKQRYESPYYVPQRERALIERLQQQNAGPFPTAALPLVFREIVSASLALENPLTVAFLGPQSTFTHLAATRQFGGSALLRACPHIGDVFLQVERGQADFGVVPVENSSEGVVSHTLDEFVQSDIKISAEIVMDINLFLLSHAASLDDVETIYSHPQASGQCRKFLAQHLPAVPLVDVESTARAAQMVREEPRAAAIASQLAAEMYRIPVLRARIEDVTDNMTRFLILGKGVPEPSGNDRTSILFSLGDGPGSLFAILKPFNDLRLNLTKIESRPSREKRWDYIFFVDLDGHITDDVVAEAVDRLHASCRLVKHLGSYPKASS